MSLGQERIQESSNQLETKAMLVAHMLRDSQTGGMGILQGKFNPSIIAQEEMGLSDYYHYVPVRGFVRNEEIRDRNENEYLIHHLGATDLYPTHDSDSFVWTIYPHHPPKIPVMELREKKGFLGTRRQVLELVGEQYMTVHGVHGTEVWTMYGLSMPIKHYQDNAGTKLHLFIAAPPDIAGSIDEAVELSPLFPDALFRSLYPGFVGPDATSHITRHSARKLLIQERRKFPYPDDRMRPFPYPVQF